MLDRVEHRKRADTELITGPPADGYVIVGHWCHYHNGPWFGLRCHNTRDCDISAMWALDREAFRLSLELAPEFVEETK